MAAAPAPGGEYNRRAAIIEDLRARQSSTEIIRFFIRDQSFMTLWQNIVLQNNQTKVLVRQRGKVTRKNAPRDSCNGRKDPSSDFGRSRTNVTKISINWRV